MNSLFSYTWLQRVSTYKKEKDNELSFVGLGQLSIEWETSSIKVTKSICKENSYNAEQVIEYYDAQGRSLIINETTYMVYQLRNVLSYNIQEDSTMPDEIAIKAEEITKVLVEYKKGLIPWDKTLYPDLQY